MEVTNELAEISGTIPVCGDDIVLESTATADGIRAPVAIVASAWLENADVFCFCDGRACLPLAGVTGTEEEAPGIMNDIGITIATAAPDTAARIPRVIPLRFLVASRTARSLPES
jgi:hypothetical protein